MTDILTRTHWHHPEWCAIAVAAGGWLLLVAAAATDPAMIVGTLEMHAPTEALVHAAIMAAAMMAPLVLDQVNHVAVSSLWQRRYRAAACYLSGYLGVWTAVAATMMVIGSRAAELIGWRTALAAAFALAVASVASSQRRFRVRQCWETRPMAVQGWPADRDCALLGVQMARRCLAASWPLMLAVTVQHGLLAMAAATALTLSERQGRLRQRQVVAMTALLAVACLAAATPVSHVHG
jgi:predicted metal-binding integral membrane protein DUF2182